MCRSLTSILHAAILVTGRYEGKLSTIGIGIDKVGMLTPVLT